MKISLFLMALFFYSSVLAKQNIYQLGHSGIKVNTGSEVQTQCEFKLYQLTPNGFKVAQVIEFDGKFNSKTSNFVRVPFVALNQKLMMKFVYHESGSYKVLDDPADLETIWYEVIHVDSGNVISSGPSMSARKKSLLPNDIVLRNHYSYKNNFFIHRVVCKLERN